jgi:hypothetical protein
MKILKSCVAWPSVNKTAHCTFHMRRNALSLITPYV